MNDRILKFGLGLWMTLLLILPVIGSAQNLPAFVADSTPINRSIPRPDEFLGFGPGEQHIRHDQLLAYMKTLAQASPRISIESIGRTHEGRELIHLFITKSEHQSHLEGMRQQHLEGDGPLVVWLGYSIHGNEASGSNAAPWVAWYLAASEEDWVAELLADSVIILDPSFNPDGLDRFAQWTNGQAGLHPSNDPNDWEHTEPWPNGRTNHYWFDLNRDWLPLVHPESRARVAQFQRWRPHVLTDHHEMGSESTFFFQPGVPARTNALTPKLNQQLTDVLGRFHAQAFDSAGELFFTREVFDDYYYGKGSTYPDVQGSVGILFEQASVRGKRVSTSFGERNFVDSVLNHFRASFSTLRGAHFIRKDLKQYRRDHEQASQNSAPKGAWIIGADKDLARAAHLLDVMVRHDIQIYPLEQTLTQGQHEYRPGQAWVIPQRQRQALLIEAIFSRPTEFADETFYDVSAFTLPLAYDLPHARLKSLPQVGAVMDSAAVANITKPLQSWQEQAAQANQTVMAYAIPWHQLNAAAFLQHLLEENVRVRIATKSYSAQTTAGPTSFTPGSLLIPLGIQETELDIHALLQEVLNDYPVEVHAITQGRSLSGPDLGSARMQPAHKVKPALVVGAGMNVYDAGEIWHFLDQRIGLSVTRVEWYRLARFPLDEYTHLLMVSGDYSQLSAAVKEKITQWVKDGGQLVLTEGASTMSESLPWGTGAEKKEQPKAQEDAEQERRSYADYEADNAERIIGGAIMALDVDTSHPLAYGIQRDELPILKNNLTTLLKGQTPYSTVAAYDNEPLMAGYASDENQKALAGKAAVTADVVGSGRLIRFADNPLFRGHWLGSSRMYANALYMGHLIRRTQLPKAPR